MGTPDPTHLREVAIGTAVTKPVVVLFDVDETLVHTGGSGARSWKAAFDKLYGIPADIGEHSSAGETDPQVARATFRGVLSRDPAIDELGKLYAQYLLHLAEDIWISEGYRVLPGAEQILLRLGEAGVMLGLVSGAMEGAARTKLVPANLNRFFVFGAYGSDSPDRAELTKLAIEKATRLHDDLTPAQVYVVGDTPHDMEATMAAGAVPVGVASGHYSTDELVAAGGVHVLGSLEDPFPGL
jgi:phosphoglycolate phosphatase-like HAD superfamily hydrolase